MENYYRVQIEPETRIAPNATVVGDVRLGKDVTVLFNATLRSEHGSRIVVGDRTNIQENCCVHLNFGCTCTVGEGTIVGHGAILHGCTVGDNTLIGMGAIIMDDAVIGNNCMVAAGALIPRGMEVPDGMLAVGSPAKIRRPLTADEIEHIRVDAADYVMTGKELAENGIIYTGSNLPTDLMTIAIR